MTRVSLGTGMRFAGSLIFIVVLFAAGLTAFAAPADSQADTELFSEAERGGSLDTGDDPTIARVRFVDINYGLLEGAEVGDALILNLFDDVVFTAILDRLEATSAEGYSWIGHLEGVQYSQVILVVRGGQMAGNIALPGENYQVRFAGNGVHANYEIDQTTFPSEAEPTAVELSEEAIAAAESNPMADDGSVIDIMVVYTADARAGAGGTTAMENLINLAVTETNQSYTNSGINPQLNLVHTAEVSYTESGDIQLDRNRLQNPSDGYMDNVHALRDTHMADLVPLVVENGGGYCGIAYIMTTVSTAFENFGFGVVARTCATGYYSFGHELGHIQAARHDWYVDDTVNSPYTYNHAYLNVGDRWRTIMGYNSECSANGVSCTRVQYWSNPDVTYGGDPMGVPPGTSTACVTGDTSHPDCDADNRLTLNNTAFTVANFRDSGATAGPLEYDSHTIDDDNFGNSIGNGDGIADCGETIELFVDLLNSGASTAIGVNATISTSDPYVTFLFNTSSSYPDIPGGSTGTNVNDFDFALDPGAPNGHVINFDLDISASNGGPWSDSFNVPVSCAVAEPDIDVDPTSFHFVVPLGGSDASIMTISNLGDATLTFNIVDQETSGPVSYGDIQGVPSDAVSADETGLVFGSQSEYIPPEEPNALTGVSVLAFGINTSEVDRLIALGATVDWLPSASDLPSLIGSYDVFYVGYGGVPGVAPFQADISAYVSSGGGLVVEQPNVAGPVGMMPAGFEIFVTTASYPGSPGNLVFTPEAASHPITVTLSPVDLSGVFDTVYDSDLGPSFTLLATHAVETTYVALAAGSHGGGRIVMHTGNLHPGAIDPGSDAYLDAMFGWATGSGAEAPWLSEDPISGSVSAAGSQPVDVMVDATGLSPGTYTGDIIISNNDPDENPVIVPVTMDVVVDPPDIEVDPTSVSSTQDPNTVVVKPLDISNVGGSDLDWLIEESPHTAAIQRDLGSGSPNLNPEIEPRTFGAIIDNGLIQLGVHDEGHLNVPDGTPSSGTGTTFVGLRYVPTNAEATAPGCLCEGWGVADAISGVTGSANEDGGGVINIAPISYVSAASTAVSVVQIGSTFEVTHDYHPSPVTPNVYEVVVTVENISGAGVDLRYRRVMDWDVEPTAFAEFVTIQGTAGAANVLFASDDGFAPADPLAGPSSINFTGDAIDDGPLDHGALFDFGFGLLPAGDSFTFTTFYGAAATEGEALGALAAVGAEVYSLGQPNTPDGPTGGMPNTFIFGFKGVGGTPLCEPGDIPWASVAPASGVTPPGLTDTVDVTFDSTGLLPDTYTGDLCISSNDPDESLVIVPLSLEVTESPGVADLWIEPPSAEVVTGGETTVDIMVADVDDLFGIQLELSFDPTLVEVVDSDGALPGIQIDPGNCPVPDIVVVNEADNTLGTIQYAASSLKPTPPCSPGGIMASITFRGLAEGTSPVAFESWLLADTDGFPIGVETVTDGEIVVIGGGRIEGFVDLQGRADDSGAEVCATAGGAPICTTTVSNGYYLLTVPPDTYTVEVEMDRYLDGSKSGVVVVSGDLVTLSTVELLGGDAVEDDVINILDLSFIGFRFGLSDGDPGWDAQADINDDLTINILDVVLAAGNFLATSPVPWP